jgi:hypothetical protein
MRDDEQRSKDQVPTIRNSNAPVTMGSRSMTKGTLGLIGGRQEEVRLDVGDGRLCLIVKKVVN